MDKFISQSTSCSHNIWSETIVKAFTNLYLYSTFNFRDTHWLLDRLHNGVRGLHLELGPLRTIIYWQSTSHKELSITSCREMAKDAWTNSRPSMLAGARNGRKRTYMYSWAGLSIRSMRSFEHVRLVTKWLRTMNLAIKRRLKSLVTTGEVIIKRS